MEAARLREEKHKAEMERYTKELEALKWENMNSRRGEVEVGILLFFFWMVATKLLDARHNSNSDFPNFNNEDSTSELTFPDF